MIKVKRLVISGKIAQNASSAMTHSYLFDAKEISKHKTSHDTDWYNKVQQDNT